MTGDSRSKIEHEIGHVADLSRAELVENWRKTFKSPPPKGIKRGLLERARAYHIQARAFGGLKPAARKWLMAIAEGSCISKSTPSERSGDSRGDSRHRNGTPLKPGVRLIREWNGVVHTVEVVEGGYTWNGETWTSLSAIARAITGARWSGPRFFGL
jgi:hypothetical protein